MGTSCAAGSASGRARPRPRPSLITDSPPSHTRPHAPKSTLFSTRALPPTPPLIYLFYSLIYTSTSLRRASHKHRRGHQSINNTQTLDKLLRPASSTSCIASLRRGLAPAHWTFPCSLSHLSHTTTRLQSPWLPSLVNPLLPLMGLVFRPSQVSRTGRMVCGGSMDVIPVSLSNNLSSSSYCWKAQGRTDRHRRL